MLKFRHLRVKMRAPKPAMMRRKEPAQIPLLPLALDLVHFLAKMEVQHGTEIERIGNSRSKMRASRMMTRGRRI
jgi:hypothetical protein